MKNSNFFFPIKTFSAETTYKILLISSILGYTINVLGLFCLTFIKNDILNYYFMLCIKPNKEIEKISFIFDFQYIGILLGCIWWGFLSDRIGRVKVLIYSNIVMLVANFMSTLANSFEIFNFFRFITGFGIAGEAIVMIYLTEYLPEKKRLFATSIIIGIALFSPSVFIIFYNVFSNIDWRIWISFFSILGVIVTCLRLFLPESEYFLKSIQLQKLNKNKVHFLDFFLNKSRIKRFLIALSIGIPIFFTITVLITNSDVFSKDFSNLFTVDNKISLICYFLGFGLSNFFNYRWVLYFKSYKKVLRIYYIISIIFISLYLSPLNNSDISYYILSLGIGLGAGYFGIFLTVGGLQYGTNIRGIAGALFINFNRGIICFFNPLFVFLYNGYFKISIKNSLIIILSILFFLAIMGRHYIKEYYGSIVDYEE